MQWTRRHTLVLAAALLGLAAAFLIKNPCTVNEWHDYYQYKHYCYSDLLPIYGAHGHDRDMVPYLEDAPDGTNEYPVLTGFFSYAVSLVTTTLQGFMTVSYLGLLAFGAATTFSIWRLVGPGGVLAWSLAPSLAIHGLTNWDLLAVGLAALAWHEWRHQRPTSAAFLFGLGGAAKLYPAFFLPFLFFAALRDEAGPWFRYQAAKRWWAGDAGDAPRPGRPERQVWWQSRTLKTLLGGTLGFGAVNLYVLLKAPHNWMAVWRFHGERHPDFETPWEAFLRPLLQPLFPHFDWNDGWATLVGTFGIIALIGAGLWLGYRVIRGADPLAAGAMLVLVFCLTNRVYSPQYTLWILPILILLGAGWRPSVLFVLADFVNFIVRYNLFTPPPGGEGWNEAWEPWSRLAVNLRWVFLAWAAWTIARRHRLLPRRGRRLVDVPAAEAV